MSANNFVLRRCRKYLPLRTIDADDLRQELAVAELTGADPAHHVWTHLRRAVNREARGCGAEDEPHRRDDDTVAANDLIHRLNLTPEDEAQVRDLYATGEYPEILRRRLREAGQSLPREAYL